ncbi:MAG: transketolase, partial [bacterium]|nr:transketolase [bacterium]
GQALNFKNLDKNDAKVFVLLGDGECAEGAVWEAASLAGHYKANNLIALIDVNALGQSQGTMYNYHLENYSKKFEASGWRTIEIDGHHMKEVLQALDAACAEKEKPVAIIAKTVKGKGVSFCEGKEGWHGKALSQADLEKAIAELGGVEPYSPPAIRKPAASAVASSSPKEPEPPHYKIGDPVATRAAYGEALVKLGAADSRVVALDGDTKNSTYSEKFMKAYPNRFFECFIAEQNMVGVALGLATRGKIPFVSTFGAFFARAYDQIRMAAISQKPIKLCGSHAGVSIGEDGPSQMALEDLAMMRAIPHMAVLYPSDAVCCEKLVFEAAQYPGMVFIRTARPATPVIYRNEENFPIGGSKVLKSSGKDQVTLVAAGITLFEALKAHDILAKEGIAVRVIDLYSVKPVDQETLVKAGKETGHLITIEDHYPEGGLGDAVLGAVSEFGIKVSKLAVNQIPRSGKPQELIDLCGVSAKSIVEKV